ncbi:GntR family transcriptional regulator [Aliiroseovarius sp. S2029]|uniref:GntR family transcriptional regulator n=1 Tax=Aliiroseovarius sp. S2029 TaxID=2936988 RepID=UPI0020BF6530|nr:GntR family transcriptional regulator [Aliiroseovarius sp. S2029]MCK8482528.1 GntR family transcriptional regulator [Aliiroseovarius sp. S2029]
MAGQTETVLNAILSGIDRGELSPGDPIDENALIAKYEVSRTPLREALLRLDAMGLILRQPRKGAVLFKPTLEEFLAILEVHARLEGQAAGLAARRISAPAGAQLMQIVDACDTHARDKGDGNPDGYYALNLEFHKQVGEASGNPFLLDMIKMNARKLLAYYRARYAYPGAIAQSAEEHRQIAALILSHKADEAEALMVRHVQFDRVTVMDLLAKLG